MLLCLARRSCACEGPTLLASPEAPEVLITLIAVSWIKSTATLCPGLPVSEPERFDMPHPTISCGYSKRAVSNCMQYLR